ncbi:hypothetical protein GIB67_013367 [Kingdonia uniflora]|uniref:F-box domain-containing protein n=1 Tax=Kingdonia uniflora TaxID=39325 RepID=A0A7J7LQT6_9MAGN|nr:hypothetical protein GIB67_013367 [Kingdonia uniflora]
MRGKKPLRIKALEKKKLSQRDNHRNLNPNNRNPNSIDDDDEPFDPGFFIGDHFYREEDCDNFCDPFNPIDHQHDIEEDNEFSYFTEKFARHMFEEDEEKEEDESADEEDEDELEAMDEVRDGAAKGVLLNVPLDIFLDIFSRLPIKSLAYCRGVCKTWRKIVRHPRFAKMHHMKGTQYTGILLQVKFFNNERITEIFCVEHDNSGSFDNAILANPKIYHPGINFDVVGSCYGLICLSEPYCSDPIYVCNPVIGEYVRIPKMKKRTNYDIVSGFGFDRVNNQYKVVRMLYDKLEYVSEGSIDFKLEGEIYTLGSNTWRSLGEVPYPLRGKYSQAFVNGALHWMTCEYIGLDVPELIISFDTSSEKFKVVTPPPSFNPGWSSHRMSLAELGGFLCLCDFKSYDHFDIWMMKDYGVESSWTKEYVIPCQILGLENVFLHPLSLMKDFGILMVLNGNSLVGYYPGSKTFRDIGIHQLPPRFHAITHVGSFVSLKNIIGPTKSKQRGTCGKWYTCMNPVNSERESVSVPSSILQRRKENSSLMAEFVNCFSIFCILVSLFLPSSAQTCSNYTFPNNKVFNSCIDLPFLDAHLSWNYIPSTKKIDIAYRATQTVAGWVAWAINPTDIGMIGSQALVAFHGSNGTLMAYSTPISSYSPSMQPGDVSFPVSNLSAAYINQEMIIFGTVGPLRDGTNVNHAWQAGGSVSNDVPQIHSTSGPNVQSFGTLDFLSG